MNKIIQGDEIQSIEPWKISENDFSSSRQPEKSLGFNSGIVSKDIASQDVEKLVKQAKEEAFAQGKELSASAENAMEEKINQMDKILQALSQPLSEMSEAVEQTLTQLSLKIAGHLFRQELTVDPEKVEKVVHEALQLLPATSRNIEIHLSHDDMMIIHNVSEGNGGIEGKYNFVDDPQLGRGDCKIISDTSQVDATLESRLESIWQTVFHNDE